MTIFARHGLQSFQNLFLNMTWYAKLNQGRFLSKTVLRMCSSFRTCEPPKFTSSGMKTSQLEGKGDDNDKSQLRVKKHVTIIRPEDVEQFDREFQELNQEMFSELIKSEEDAKMLELVLNTYEYVRYTTGFVPSTISIDDMSKLLQMRNNFRIEKFLKHLCNGEIRRLIIAKNKEEHKNMIIEKRQQIYQEGDSRAGIMYDEETGRPVYSLWKNCLFLRFSNETMPCRYSRKLMEAAFFGQPLVFDFGYESELNEQEMNILLKEVTAAFAANRQAKYAYQLYFCNYKKGSKTDQRLIKHIGNLHNANSFVITSEKSYTELFPRKKLIYLTKNSRKELKEYSHDDVYIVGAIQDRQNERKLSFEKAKAERLPMCRLPLDSYVSMLSKKDLNISLVLRILNACKNNNGDWNEAFKEIPDRQLKSTEQIKQEQMYRMQNMSSHRKVFFKGKKTLNVHSLLTSS